MAKYLFVFFLFASMSCFGKSHTVTVTCYQPVAAQCNSNPLVTADGSRIQLDRLKSGELRWCAVSRDLLKQYPYGSKIYIDGYGWYEVHDTCNKRYRLLVDILIHPSSKGVTRHNVRITDGHD